MSMQKIVIRKDTKAGSLCRFKARLNEEGPEIFTGRTAPEAAGKLVLHMPHIIRVDIHFADGQPCGSSGLKV